MVRVTYCLLKNLKLFYFIPIIVTLVYMPFISVYFYYSVDGQTEIYFKMMFEQFQLFLPLFSVWWVIFVLKEFMESEGNELLYLYNKPLYLLRIILLLFTLYVLHTSAFLFVFHLVFGEHLFVVLQIAVSCFTMCALAYFISFALRSTGVALLFSIAYGVFLNLFDLDRNLAGVSLFAQTKELTNISMLRLALTFTDRVLYFLSRDIYSQNTKGHIVSFT